HRLGKLVAIVDRNGFQLDGSVDDVIGIEPLADKWRAFGWNVHEVDGHDAAAVRDLLLALAERPDGAAPSCVIAQTKKGKGVSYME
ncbi:transketolase, partial [Burkholderia sp. SIMBA_024]